MAFVDYWSHLQGRIPNLDPLAAQVLLNRGWKDIREARLWSWTFKQGTYIAPQIVTAGTVTVTQFLTTVAFDATAQAALASLANPLITQRQFRCGVGGGAIYSIIAYNPGTGVATLDRPYLEPSAAGQPYQVYRCYYTNPDPNNDFLMNRVILNPIDGYAIVGPNLRMSKAEIDARDPTRGAQDLSYLTATFQTDANGLPIYEFWPHPTSARGYICLYNQRGKELSTLVDIPATVSPHMVMHRGLYYAYDWAIENMGRYEALKGVDWRLLKVENQRTYDKMIQDARRQDDNIFLDSYIPQLRDYLTYPPIDSRFLQSHDWGSLGWFE